MILGSVNTTCRCGTGTTSSSTSHRAHAVVRFAAHEGQRFLDLQLNGTRYSALHSGQRTRAKPCSGSPQRREADTVRSITRLSLPQVFW